MRILPLLLVKYGSLVKIVCHNSNASDGIDIFKSYSPPPSCFGYFGLFFELFSLTLFKSFINSEVFSIFLVLLYNS